MTNLTVTDNLGAYEFNSGTVYPLAYVSNSVRYYVNGVLQTAPTATSEPPLVITVPNVPANGSIMLVYEAEVTAYAPLGTDGSITNTANVTDGNLEVSASETVSTEDRAVLTISKALCPAVVTGNGQITYTFVIENTGNTEASEAERIVLTDTFDPILKNIAVTFNGTAWTAGTQYTYGETTGVFATLPGQITVPAAQFSGGAASALLVPAAAHATTPARHYDEMTDVLIVAQDSPAWQLRLQLSKKASRSRLLRKWPSSAETRLSPAA